MVFFVFFGRRFQFLVGKKVDLGLGVGVGFFFSIRRFRYKK